jgi:hypothetical protein
MNQKKPIIYALISFALFFIASFYITYPLLFHLGDRVTGFGDELLIAWIQNWVIHSLMTKPFGVFDSNLYYPYHNTLAYTETFMVTSILAIPAKFIVGEPIATVNFTLFSSIILFGFSIYLLCYFQECLWYSPQRFWIVQRLCSFFQLSAFLLRYYFSCTL